MRVSVCESGQAVKYWRLVKRALTDESARARLQDSTVVGRVRKKGKSCPSLTLRRSVSSSSLQCCEPASASSRCRRRLVGLGLCLLLGQTSRVLSNRD